MRKKRPTLKDVAKIAGVSYQTVSKVIQGKVQVTSQTRQSVWEAVRIVGYQPNQTARNLRATRSHSIGYTWRLPDDEAGNPILEKFLDGMMRAAEHYDYSLLCFPGRRNMDELIDLYLKVYATGKVDGFVLSEIDEDDPRETALSEHQIPYVSFGRSSESVRASFVEVDGQIGMMKAVEHLVGEGHERIGLLAWEGSSRVGSVRERGYRSAMAAHQLPISADWVVYGLGNFYSGYQLTRKLLTNRGAEAITAIAAMNDLMAIGAIRAIQEAGKIVGRDVAVTGFDDFPLTAFIYPGLTTLRQPAHLAGKAVVKLLVDQLEGRNQEPQHVIYEPELVVRASSLRKEPENQKEQ